MTDLNDNDQQPPVFRTWSGWYFFLIAVLLVQIALYYWLTVRYS